jgi:hypothetical protein
VSVDGLPAVAEDSTSQKLKLHCHNSNLDTTFDWFPPVSCILDVKRHIGLVQLAVVKYGPEDGHLP